MIKGEVIESGTHEQLVAQNGFYRMLVDTQKLHQQEDERVVKQSEEEIVKEEVAKLNSPPPKDKDQSGFLVSTTALGDVETGLDRKMSFVSTPIFFSIVPYFPPVIV
jgi:carbonic anhydrase